MWHEHRDSSLLRKINHELLRYYPKTNSFLIKNLEKPEHIIERIAFPGKNNLLKHNDFSCGITLYADSLQMKNMAIETWGIINFEHEPKDGLVVISLLNEKDSIIEYKTWPIKYQLFGPSSWETTYNSANFFNVKPGHKLKIYFWNPGDTPFRVKQLKVRVGEIKGNWLNVLKV